MHRLPIASLVLLLVATTALAGPQDRRWGRRNPDVFRDRVDPHWFAGGTRFWYRNDLADGQREFVLVDAEAGTRALAFDHAALAAALGQAVGTDVAAERLPFERIELADDRSSVRFKVGDVTWRYTPADDACETSEASPALDAEPEPPFGRGRGFGRGRDGRGDGPVESPDGRWSASVRDGDVVLRAAGDGDGEGADDELALTADGAEGAGYGGLEWSPDSTVLAAWRIHPVERQEVYLVRSSPRDGGRAQLEQRGYSLPGDPFTTRELCLFDAASGKRSEPDLEPFEHEWLRPDLHWYPDGRRFAWEQVDRGHQRLRVIEVDSHTGEVRDLIDERTDTFIWTAHTENVGVPRVTWLERTAELIYASERDGWRHLYLVDVETGDMRPITRGQWVVRGVDRIDEEARQVWFSASGMNADQDPYFVHHYRIGFDGSGLVALTEGDGDHTVRWSPDRRWLIDSWSRVDRPPVNELRRSSDGALVCGLEEADIERLAAKGWEPPEVFAAKGRDGVTDIWGLIAFPAGYDPAKSYPVIEDIYAGPQDSFVPKTFSSRRRYAELADLGFIVVKIDGMGTANRSKAFHDECWHDLKDAGFEDRIAWMKAAAERHPAMDLTRVGIFGGSAGGQNAAGALLFHPEFYKVAVANCGCHDNRMDKASWNEQWMGYPVGPWYSECSNIDNAERLQGKLFLIVGEMDTNVPPESTLRFADALVRARKDFDLLVVPGAGHGAAGAPPGYVTRRTHDFFVRHLLGVEPPDRNAAPVGEPEDTARTPQTPR